MRTFFAFLLERERDEGVLLKIASPLAEGGALPRADNLTLLHAPRNSNPPSSPSVFPPHPATKGYSLLQLRNSSPAPRSAPPAQNEPTPPLPSAILYLPSSSFPPLPPILYNRSN